MSAVLDYLKESGVFYLSTMDGNQPRVRPFGAVCEFEGKLYFITAIIEHLLCWIPCSRREFS